MNARLKWKALFIAAVILACLYGLIGLPKFPTSWAQVKENFGQQIKLGLDLQGGTHLILQVQVQEAVSQQTDQVVDRLTQQLRAKNIRYEEVRRVDDTHILVRNVASENAAQFHDLVTEQLARDWDVSVAPGEASGSLLTLRPSTVAAIQQQTMQQSLDTLERRINGLGLTEPTIQFHGRNDNEILIQLPGEGDPSRAKAVIKAGGQLELRLVEDPTTYPSEIAGLSAHNGVLPLGTELVRGSSQAHGSSRAPEGEVWYLLSRAPVVTGRDLRSVQEDRNPDRPGTWKVNFSLSVDAARRFGPFTEQNLGRQMAIVLEHRVYSAPVINGHITDSGFIEGTFGQEEAHDLALVLRAGALPASIKYLEERTVGPSLGADSIRHGMRASILSLLVVMVFMLVYYRLAGANAVVALILNLVILLAALAYLGAVVTLPGIAGVILTIGMGVDSNVLVFERIREELRNGKSPVSAVDAGFSKALLTIIDTHVTTVVSAFFLFAFGTGPIKGFAITLTIGLIANLFTAIYVSKTIFGFHLVRMDRQAQLSI
ncbi:MAG TPA: protein translocase subunit SecD [Candidatus Acidoferrales bacterium]|nr:protein translocase subunit SecD [Candidatus Acidoferrales bacterium]